MSSVQHFPNRDSMSLPRSHAYPKLGHIVVLTILTILVIIGFMNTLSIGTTDLKKNISDVINRVYYEKVTAIVVRHDKPVAKIIPIDVRETSLSLASKLDQSFGSMPDFPSVSAHRYFRHRTTAL